MEPTKELIDDIYRGKVVRAARATPEQKFLMTGELFDEVRERMEMGIRYQFPEADDTRVREILRNRYVILRKLRGNEVE